MRLLSDRARRWVAHGIDRFRGRFYEGPNPPALIQFRVQEVLRRFEGEELEVVLIRLAENCYREGYERGFEWLERDWEGPEIEPERLIESEGSGPLPFDHLWPMIGATPEQRIQFEAVMGAGIVEASDEQSSND